MSIIYTIGYEGASVPDFLATLKAVGVQRVVDVRQLPQSRRAGFSKKSLAEALDSQKISYEHRRHLGDPKPGRDAAKAGKHEEFKRIFLSHMATEAARSELVDLSATLALEVGVLLCYERDYRHCHRSILCDHLLRLGSFEIRHIGVQPMSRSGGRATNATERYAGAY